jgi:hypothetical protein
MKICVFDMAGKQLFSLDMICRDKTQIEISGLPAWPGGTYQLIAVSESGVKRQTLVKQ